MGTPLKNTHFFQSEYGAVRLLKPKFSGLLRALA